LIERSMASTPLTSNNTVRQLKERVNYNTQTLEEYMVEIDNKINIDAQTISSKVTSTQNARLVFKDLSDNIRALFSLDRLTNAWSVITRHPTNGDINKVELSGNTVGGFSLNGNQIFHAGNMSA